MEAVMLLFMEAVMLLFMEAKSGYICRRLAAACGDVMVPFMEPTPCAWYAECGTETAYGAMRSACYGICGTETAYGAISPTERATKQGHPTLSQYRTLRRRSVAHTLA
eukprot:3940408-Rhodomonas_salina.2